MRKPPSASHELTAFISSTYVDLKAHRARVEEALTRIEAGFRSMRFFGSNEGDCLVVCLEKLRQCNYYVAIVGHRYGQVHDLHKLSYTELEYEEAKRLKMSRRIYMADSSVPISPEHLEPDERRQLLEAFKRKLRKENTVVEFSTPDDLATKVLADILVGLPQKHDITLYARDRYLPAIRAACASISFLGLDIQSMKRHKDIKLERVYVSNKFRPLTSPGELPALRRSPLKRGPQEVSSAGEEEPLTLSALLSPCDSAVILGAPGSGKTTLAKYLVVAIADRAPEVSFLAGEGIPIRVPLRSYAEYRQRFGGVGKSITDFLADFVKTELQIDSLPEGFFEFYLERRRALLVFDGLDEIFDSHLRDEVKNDIVAFTQRSYPGNKVLITSRKFRYEEAGLPDPDFTHFEILPFDSSQISEYVRKWYTLEEADQRKRKDEIAAFHQASQNLPQELLSNPLLLSLIVILFRSGCTLPESKLEIYRSCVGTLTEKWDAAGKKLELPPQYNLVRDKKGAFARIAYWMYKELSEHPERQVSLKYPQILGELTRYLSEREFRGRESDAQQAAESFLDYAAKRSIFVEDRFTHKTFHEYFAALYLFGNFCLGRTPRDLYTEIKPYMSSDYWAVAVELLLLMVDEHAGQLVESLFERIVADVRSSPEELNALLLVPIRTIAELQNIGQDSVSSLISAAVEVCMQEKHLDSWSPRLAEEAPHQRIFQTLEDIPDKYLGLLAKSLREAASAAQGPGRTLDVAAFRVEFYGRPNLPKPADIIPNWDSVNADFARLHLGGFYEMFADAPVADELEAFVSFFGRERLFLGFQLVFRPHTLYISMAEYAIESLRAEQDAVSYSHSVESLLASDLCDSLLRGFIEKGASSDWPLARFKIPLHHLMQDWENRKKYCLDWLVLGASASAWDRVSSSQKKSAVRKLRRLVEKGCEAQSFYASLLLGFKPKEITAAELGLTTEIATALLGKVARIHEVRKRRRLRQH